MFHEYEHLSTYGITSTGFTLAVHVRNGLLDRHEALERENLIRKNLKNRCKEIAVDLGVNVDHLLVDTCQISSI